MASGRAQAELDGLVELAGEDAVPSRDPESPRMRRLLGDLETIMMSEGFLHLSTDDIARRLRCSKASLYRLAPSREELFELVIGRWLARMREAGYREVMAADGWPAKFIGHIAVVRASAKEASQRFMQDLGAFPRGYAILADHQRRRIEMLEFIIAGGLEAGDFKSIHVRLAADLILTSLRRVVDPDFLASVGLSMADAADEWLRILAFGVINHIDCTDS